MINVILQPNSNADIIIDLFCASCPCGGIGRRSRLKICRSQGREGSIPFVGTKPSFTDGFFMPKSEH
jgi:hypothetical protein